MYTENLGFHYKILQFFNISNKFFFIFCAGQRGHIGLPENIWLLVVHFLVPAYLLRSRPWCLPSKWTESALEYVYVASESWAL